MPITQTGIRNYGALSGLFLSWQSPNVFAVNISRNSSVEIVLQIFMTTPTTMKPVFFFIALWMSFFSTRGYALTFNEWRALNFTPDQLADQTISGQDADPDNDSYSNLIEFAYHSSPIVSDIKLMVPSRLPDGRFVYELPWQADRPVMVVMEYSNDLQDWTFGIDLTQYAIVDQKLIASDQSTLARSTYRFRRLKITSIEIGEEDEDGDGLDDAYEIDTFGDINTAIGFEDSDGDSILNVYESLGSRIVEDEVDSDVWAVLNANSADSDGDGISDENELKRGSVPSWHGSSSDRFSNKIYLEADVSGDENGNIIEDFGELRIRVQGKTQSKTRWNTRFHEGRYIASGTLHFVTSKRDSQLIEIFSKKGRFLREHLGGGTYGTISGGQDFESMGVGPLVRLRPGVFEFTNVPISDAWKPVFTSYTASAEFFGPLVLGVGEWSRAPFGFRWQSSIKPTEGAWAWTSEPASISITCSGPISLTDRFGNGIGKVLSLGSSEAIQAWLNNNFPDGTNAPQVGLRGNSPGVASIKVRTKTRTQDVSTEHFVIVQLPHIDLATDLDNDGQITSTDFSLRELAVKPGASDADKEQGTEYMFINDKMSNGVWDADDEGLLTFSYGAGNLVGLGTGYDRLPKPPATHKDDDDAEPLKVQVNGLNTGVVWFDHPTIDKLEFFKTKECKLSDKLNMTSSSPFELSTGKLPETIYMRLRDDWAVNDQGGNLRMFVGKTVDETWAELKLPLTMVRDFGAKNFFHAARDYILENNSRVCIRDHGYPFGPNPDTIFRLCVMREEATKMSVFDAKAGGQTGIQAAYAALPAVPGIPAVVINGNQCFWTAGWDENNPFDWNNMHGNIADKCHGRVIRGSVTAAISSDNYDPTTKPAKGSQLAGPDPIPAGIIAGPDGISGTADDVANPDAGTAGGKYVGYNTSAWTFAAGRAGGADALGGLSTNYASEERADEAHQLMGYAKGPDSGKGCIFTATQIKGVGYGTIVKGDASIAGVPALSPSADAGAIKLFILDSGAGSLALMHIDPAGTMRGAYMGRKTNWGFPYYVNNYLALYPAPGRP